MVFINDYVDTWLICIDMIDLLLQLNMIVKLKMKKLLKVDIKQQNFLIIQI